MALDFIARPRQNLSPQRLHGQVRIFLRGTPITRRARTPVLDGLPVFAVLACPRLPPLTRRADEHEGCLVGLICERCRRRVLPGQVHMHMHMRINTFMDDKIPLSRAGGGMLWYGAWSNSKFRSGIGMTNPWRAQWNTLGLSCANFTFQPATTA